MNVSPASTSRPHSYLRLLGGVDDAAPPYVGQTECPGAQRGDLVKCRDGHRELISLLNPPGDRRTIADETTAINAYDSLFILFFHHLRNCQKAIYRIGFHCYQRIVRNKTAVAVYGSVLGRATDR